jgi:hypothetical protein
LAEIAEELCVMQRYLRAIEQDDLKSLPGTFFYKSFVRQYASLLGVDQKQIQAGVDLLTLPAPDAAVPTLELAVADRQEAVTDSLMRHVDPLIEATNKHYFSDRRIGMSVASLAVALLACSGFYAWWNRSPSPTPIPVISQRVSPAASPAALPASVALEADPEPDGINRVVLNLAATEKTWLSITSDGKQVFSGILEPSQTKVLTGMDIAKVKVGNAGGLEVRWNGKPIGPIGSRGEVREVLFTPENFEILPKAPAPVSDTL